MRLFNPETSAQLAARDQMLQDTMRPKPAAFPIASEYPLVLAPQHRRFSHCLGDQDHVCAHANLWPRRLLLAEGDTSVCIGLVGNVATDPLHRGHGLMKRLMAELMAKAEVEALSALILWSDLEEFYQKLGFRSFGQELRFMLPVRGSPAARPALKKLAPGDVDTALAAALLRRRHPTACTLARSPLEFATLLTIPCTNVFVVHGKENKHEVDAYLVVGKGYDMQGVIHEWGASSPELLLSSIDSAARQLGVEALMLLTPGNLTAPWQEAIEAKASSRETHPMAWIYETSQGGTFKRPPIPPDFFIWGLDSI